MFAVAFMALWQLRLAANEPTIVSSPSAAVAPRAAEPSRSADEAEPTDHRRLREGAQLTNRLGHFRQNGDAIAFIDEDGRDIGGLPNLNLERITRTLKTVEEPESIWWSISGTITEFAGRNYVLITRAVYKATTPPPVPDRLEELED
jgi:hypothetical protein